MYAIVRKIEEGTEKRTREHHDSFVEDMVELIGKKLRFKKMTGKPGWYSDSKDDWNFHKSWLKEVK